jgi:glutamate/tyrosine decarboxylase-like PLP-dependent enzyme
MPERGEDAPSVLQLLDDVGSPATMATAGPRYFGYVVDGALPPTVAANWLAAAWDQNVGLFLASPVGAHLEQVILEWLLDSLELPSGLRRSVRHPRADANFTALAAARLRCCGTLDGT